MTPNKRPFLFLTFLIAPLLLTACENNAYYAQAISGHLALLDAKRPIEKLITDPSYPEKLKKRLRFVMSVRKFAADELHLPIDGSYESFVNLDRPFVLWNIFATPEFSLKPKRWCYPVVGCMSYRGYFAKEEAQELAKKLRGENLDVFVGGVSAYSTLGWFDDPLTSAMLRRSDIRLAWLLFHELAHKLLYIEGDTKFNESFATAVAQEGTRRWILANGGDEAFSDYLRFRSRQQKFVDLVMSYRPRFEELYKSDIPEAEMEKRKEKLFDQLRKKYGELKVGWGGNNDFDRWFAKSLNNAKLNSLASYEQFTPAFDEMLKDADGDLEKFYEKCRTLGKKSKEERTARLVELLATQ